MIYLLFTVFQPVYGCLIQNLLDLNKFTKAQCANKQILSARFFCITFANFHEYKFIYWVDVAKGVII